MADKLDFSKFERLAPREDSWAKVCERLDAEADAVSASKFISIKSWYKPGRIYRYRRHRSFGPVRSPELVFQPRQLD